MREFKFRAWDKLGKEMLYQGKILDEDDNIRPSLFEFFSIAVTDVKGNKSKNVMLMQFTGVSDRKGKNIYEGDIVRDWNNKVVSQVKFEAGIFLLGNVDYEDYFVPIHEFVNCENDCEELEVIGNIYENKELLTEK